MLNFTSKELIEPSEINYNFDCAPTPTACKIEPVKILAEKISLPVAKAEVERKRLFEHLEQSLTKFFLTLVTGRAGMGKTALALDFARHKNYAVAWYTIENSDRDWKIFLGYLKQSLLQLQADSSSFERNVMQLDEAENWSVTESLAACFAAVENKRPLLIVLDDLHSVYDVNWFGEFFNAILSLPNQNVRVLLLARSAPPFPLWRLRSKHVLDVVDEKLLAFTVSETIELFGHYKLSEKAARVAHKRAYGRIAKLRGIAEKR